LEYLNYCVEGAHRTELLISDLLAYSQATKGAEAPAQPVDIKEVLAEVGENLATTIEETRATIAVTDLPIVMGDIVPPPPSIPEFDFQCPEVSQ
jgi:light-regulated signal transduction histidine kinase (bacteriophytochrome)